MSQTLFRFTEVPDSDGLTPGLSAWYVECQRWSWWRGWYWAMWTHQPPYSHEPRYFSSVKQASVAAHVRFNPED